MVHISMVDLRKHAAFADTAGCGAQQRSDIIDTLRGSLRERGADPTSSPDEIEELRVLLGRLGAFFVGYSTCQKDGATRVLQVPDVGPPWPPCPDCMGACLDAIDIATPVRFHGDGLAWIPEGLRWAIVGFKL
jgi:hypothetical protein